MPDNISKTGIWSQPLADKIHTHCQSENALPELMKNFFNISQPVIDFGCGNGYYLKRLADIGFKCYGVEGSKLDNFVFDPNKICITDLSEPLRLCYNKYDDDTQIKGNVISLEVAEHIPKQYEQIFLDTITEHCADKLIFSWAVTGQPGEGHVNCVEQLYAIHQIQKRGFWFDSDLTQIVRAQIENNVPWFRNTLLIFHRNK